MPGVMSSTILTFCGPLVKQFSDKGDIGVLCSFGPPAPPPTALPPVKTGSSHLRMRRVRFYVSFLFFCSFQGMTRLLDHGTTPRNRTQEK